MATSIQAVCKNTFISFVAEGGDEQIPVSMRPLPRFAFRSRSAQPARCNPEADHFEELAKQSLHRLNAVLSIGMSSPPQSPCQEEPQVKDGFMLDQPETVRISSENSSGLSQLRSLQGKLAKALAGDSVTCASPLQKQKPWDRKRRVSSSCSLSTMAPDDSSEFGEACSTVGLRRMPKVCSSNSVASMVSDNTDASGSFNRMPKVWSSGSVSSMVSAWSDIIDDDEKEEAASFEFELDIEAGAKAALEQRKGEKVPTAAKEEGTTSRSAVSPEMSHNQVPKNQDMAKEFDSNKNEPPTTMMIRNVPGRYSQNHLMMDLQDLGLGQAYDFLYIPMDKSTAANVGYAFVNFIDAESAQKCVQLFQDYRFNRHQKSSTKMASVSIAHLQGLEKNLQHYQNAAVNMSRDKRRRPVVAPKIGKSLM